MKKIAAVLLVILLFISCTTPLRVTEVEYVTLPIKIERAVQLLEANRPDTVPEFPNPLAEGADDVETLRYLGNVISAYKTSLEAWQNYSEAQHEVILTLQEELI